MLKSSVFYLIGLCLILTISKSFSQSQKISFGPVLGANMSTFRGDDVRQFKGMAKFKPGFTGGLYFLSRFKYRKLNFETGLYYTNRGNSSRYINDKELDGNAFGRDYSYVFKTGYLEVPLLLRYYIAFAQFNRAYLLFGPTYGGLVRAKREETAPLIQNLDVRNELQRDDFGFTVGYGYTFFLIDRWYCLSLKYFHGLRNANDYNGIIERNMRPNIVNNAVAEFKNSTISFTFSVGLERNIKYSFQ
jgi:hypothetical protein